MSNNLPNPFAGRGAVSLEEFLRSAAPWQQTMFNERCQTPHFDWQVIMRNTQLFPPGTSWKASWGETDSCVAPYVVLNTAGEPMFIRPYFNFGVTVSVVPLRQGERGVEVGAVIQYRPSVNLLAVAGVLRKFVANNETPAETAVRALYLETGCKPVGAPLPLGSFNADYTVFPVSQPLFAIWCSEPDPNAVPPKRDMIIGVKWLTCDELLERFYQGVYQEDCGQAGILPVHYDGAIEWMPLQLVIPRISVLAKAWAAACVKIP